MLQVIGDIRPYLEAAYFFSGVLVAAGLAVTLKKINLIKSDIIIKNERLSKDKAIEACLRYFDRFVPLDNKYYESCRKRNLKSYNGPIGNFTKDSISLDEFKLSIKRLDPDTWLAAQNELEAISAFFTCGVADERTGFSVIARTFCSNVELRYDLISLFREREPLSYWQNTVTLYSIWRPRLSKAELGVLSGKVAGKDNVPSG